MFIDSFIRYLKGERGYSSHTLRAYRNDVTAFEEFLSSVDESCSLQDVDADIVRMWVSSLMDSGAAASSMARKLSCLRTFYSYLCSVGVVSSNPVVMVSNPKGKKRLPTFLKEDDMDRILDFDLPEDDFCSLCNKTILHCFYGIGLRLAELVGLNVSDVDMGLLHLKVVGKGNRERIIPFTKELHDIFDVYLKERAGVALPGEEAFFVSQRGTRVSRSSVYRMVRSKLLDLSTLAKCSPHVLRHTYATAMLNNGAELMVVKELLGHKRLATTEVYTHMTFEELKRYYKKAHPRAGNN